MELYRYFSIFRKLLVLMRRNVVLPFLYLLRVVCLVLKSCVGVYIAFNTLHPVLLLPERPRPSGNAFVFEIQALTIITLHFGSFCISFIPVSISRELS